MDINKNRPESNGEDQQMFSVHDTEPVYIKQEEDHCTEILPDLDGDVSGIYTLNVNNFSSFISFLIILQIR
jgi:hypothetical protein